MIEDRIKRLRKNAGMSQEQLAVRLSVVRQTVSKWETGLSVPDAEIVIKMAELFHVSVNEILGVDPSPSVEDITEELARANALLAEKAGKQKEGIYSVIMLYRDAPCPCGKAPHCFHRPHRYMPCLSIAYFIPQPCPAYQYYNK